MNFQAVVSFYGIKQFFEVMNGAKFFFNGIACFMLLREIVETVFFNENVKQFSHENSRGYFESY